MRGSLVLYTISWLLVEQDRFWYFFLRWENGEVRIPGWVMMVLSHFMQIWQSKEFVYCKEGVEVRWGVCFKTVLKQSSFVLKKKKQRQRVFLMSNLAFFNISIWIQSIFASVYKTALYFICKSSWWFPMQIKELVLAKSDHLQAGGDVVEARVQMWIYI